MTPFLGQGGCSALRDAINLAWKLDLVLRGIASDRLLDTYEEERKPHVRVHIHGSDKVGALAFISDPAEAAVRDRLFLSGNAPPPPAEPTLVSGVLHPGDPLAGSLAPQSLVRHAGKEGRFDDLFGWGFQLIGWRCNPADHLRADELRFLERIGTAVVGLSEENDVTGAYAEFFHGHQILGLLARPDFVVFGAARRADQFGALVSNVRRAVSW
jgi:3-(3-hydroxy-phenyl)propionate hydroxylase